MSLAPALLLSMPQLIDPNFARTVVLLCEHAAEGAFGLVVNRPSEVSAAEAVQLEPPVAHPNDLPLLIGGPVEPQRGWILTASEPDGVESRELGSGLYLDKELADSAWLIMPVELDLIFEIPSAGVWEMAIRRLGADPHMLQMGHGVH